LWTAHYKSNGFLDFVDCATSADNTASAEYLGSPEMGITK